MDEKKVLFSKNWYKAKYRDKYYINALPGNKEDISGSTFKGYSIGVNKYIDNSKKQSAKDTIKYLSSEEGQMNITRDLGVFCGMDKVYENESFCKNDAQEFCDIYKKLQIVVRPYSLTEDYDKYSNKVIEYLHQYLYKDESSSISANETLAKIDDITKVYYIEATSFLGNFMFWTPTVTLVIMFLSFFTIYNYKIGKKFIFFTKFYWFTYLLGLGLIMSYMYTNTNTITSFKCQIKTVLLSVGFTLTITVQCLRLISNFPTKTNFVISVEKNLSLIVSCLVYLDVISSTNFFFVSYTNDIYYIDDGKNYRRCQFLSLDSKLLLGGIFLYKMLVVVLGYIYIYLEWNDIFLKLDIRMISYSYIVSSVLGIVFIIFSFIDNDMNQYYFIKNIIIYLYCVINYILTFFYKFFIPSSFYEKNNINIKYAIFNDGKDNQVPDNIRKLSEGFNNRFNDVRSKMKNYHNGSLYSQNQQKQNTSGENAI